jgi:hypothetical protein
MNLALRPESRRFLSGLTFDNRGYPLHEGRIAGIDLCLTLCKKKTA